MINTAFQLLESLIIDYNNRENADVIIMKDEYYKVSAPIDENDKTVKGTCFAIVTIFDHRNPENKLRLRKDEKWEGNHEQVLQQCITDVTVVTMVTLMNSQPLDIVKSLSNIPKPHFPEGVQQVGKISMP